MNANPTTAEHLREAILAALAQSDAPLTVAELFDRIDSAESRQAVAAQISRLKKTGQIDSWQTDAGVMRHTLAVATPVMPETETEQPATTTPTLDLPDVDLHRIVWSQTCGGSTRFLTLTVNGQPRLNTSGFFAIDPALLRQMADLIETMQQREAA